MSNPLAGQKFPLPEREMKKGGSRPACMTDFRRNNRDFYSFIPLQALPEMLKSKVVSKGLSVRRSAH